MNESEIVNPNIDKEKKLPWFHRGHLFPLSENYPTIDKCNDLLFFHNFNPSQDRITSLETLEDLLKRDEQREKDGFHRRIRLGKFIKPLGDNKNKVIVVPTTTEPKFYHDESMLPEETGGSGEGEEGQVIGKQRVRPTEGEGEGQGAGQGEGAEHEIVANAFNLGKILTEKFQLPNIKQKGKKRSLTKFSYELTDINRRQGQLVEKKSTLRKIVKTNLLLGNINPNEPIDTSKLLVTNDDMVYRLVSKERDYDTQAVVFFVRDYSGSMEGKPTEAITSQHLMIYSWLVYQYQYRVETRFIVHDTEPREVTNFTDYFQLQVAGGTRIAPAFQKVYEIIQRDQLAKEYNIYIFYGTDGDDWDTDGKELNENLIRLFPISARIGFTIAKNSWSLNQDTTLEKNLKNYHIAEKYHKEFRMDSFDADNIDENRLIESIKILVED
ncbi:MAG TPA: DUF444 family protein [Bacteroidales bacterium]|nr:DUF444 family protein [Bacteroidales bacterium]